MGLYEHAMECWGRYRLPILHTETNMRDELAERWFTQQLIELTSAAASGVPVLGATWYSLMDQVGWENGLNGEIPRSAEEASRHGRLNAIGMFSLLEHEPRASAKIMRELVRELAREGTPAPRRSPVVGVHLLRSDRAKTDQ
jgi:beta-glucosidase/6-phospho-beta-glucosidase/beta-galactosidase